MIKLAWRNLWRNKRRTLITSASVFFAVFFAIIMKGVKHGVMVYLINSVLHSYTGFIQIHENGYWENKTFEYSMHTDDPDFNKVKTMKSVRGLIPGLNLSLLLLQVKKQRA